MFETLHKIKNKESLQYVVSFSLIALTSISCYLSLSLIDYRVVALILLLVVSVIAMLFKIRPVLFTAILSAFIWNFFFILPTYTFGIDNPEDTLLFSMYFVIALLNAVLTSKIRKAEQEAREKEEKEKTIELYNTLLNSLSHELRTPIATIIGTVDTLKENKKKLPGSLITDMLSEIEKAGLRLNRQVDNLLNMSRLESGFVNLQLDWTDMDELIYTILENNNKEFNKHTIIYQTSENIPLFKIDRALMEQVIYNLLHNAVQYTPVESFIYIDIKHKDSFCIIEIKDSGKGFPEDKVEHVFEKFYRLPDSATGGTGLGLSIVKGFVEAQHGKIKLINKPGSGAIFIIKIPVETTNFNPNQHA